VTHGEAGEAIAVVHEDRVTEALRADAPDRRTHVEAVVDFGGQRARGRQHLVAGRGVE
jgi:hypothetical protein